MNKKKFRTGASIASNRQFKNITPKNQEPDEFHSNSIYEQYSRDCTAHKYHDEKKKMNKWLKHEFLIFDDGIKRKCVPYYVL